VPGIGPATAQKILQMRKSYGPFKSVDDLLAIRGLGEKRLNKMRKYLTVGKANAPKAEPPGKSPAVSEKPPNKSREKPKEQKEGFLVSPEMTIAGVPAIADRRVHESGGSSEDLVSGLGSRDAERHLIGDANPIAFEGHDFFRVIGEDANVFEA